MYEILLLAPAQKDLDKLEAKTFGRILGRIRALRDDARPAGCLKLSDENAYRLRVGDYRILYRIDDAGRRVYVYRIKHRKNVYA